VNGLVYIGHGRSDAKALISAVKLARNSVENHLMDEIRVQVQNRLFVS
jgi:glycerol-3-phosphate acyltransferase PlsX